LICQAFCEIFLIKVLSIFEYHLSNALGVVLSLFAGVEREEQEQVFVPPKIKQMRQRSLSSSISVAFNCKMRVDNLFIVITSFSFGTFIITQAEHFVKSFLKIFLKIFMGLWEGHCRGKCGDISAKNCEVFK
jgi:hypothetical protein